MRQASYRIRSCYHEDAVCIHTASRHQSLQLEHMEHMECVLTFLPAVIQYSFTIWYLFKDISSKDSRTHLLKYYMQYHRCLAGPGYGLLTSLDCFVTLRNQQRDVPTDSSPGLWRKPHAADSRSQKSSKMDADKRWQTAWTCACRWKLVLRYGHE